MPTIKTATVTPSITAHITATITTQATVKAAIARASSIALIATIAPTLPAWAETTVQVGASGATFASSAVMCATNPNTGLLSPTVEAGLFNPRKTAQANVALNGAVVARVNSTTPAATVWLADGSNSVVVALKNRLTDTYAFSVQPGLCNLPDTSGNTFSDDGILEYAASGKSSATVEPGCALNPVTGLTQPYVNLFDNGSYLLNISINGTALTQLSSTNPHTPVFLGAGANVISAANGFVSTDYYVREGGDGSCVLP
jgi:hypothetical protein